MVFTGHGMMMFQYFWQWSVTIILVIGVILWYFYSRIEKRITPKKEVDTSKVLKLLNPVEKKIMEKLISLEGVALQSDLSRELNKLKVHRAVKSLESKGIIEVTPKGRTRFIRISKEFKEFL